MGENEKARKKVGERLRKRMRKKDIRIENEGETMK